MPSAEPPAAASQDSPWEWRPAGPCWLDQPVQWLRLQGADVRRFLHGQTSQAVELAGPGSWLSTCCIGPTARMKAVAEVLLDPEGAWLVITAGDGGGVRQALDRVLFPADAVTLGPLRPGRLLQPLTPMPGEAPAAAGADSGRGEVPPAAAGRSWRPGPAAGSFWLGEALLLLEPEAEAALSPLPLPGRCLNADEAERWRIQQGQPAAASEIHEEVNPFELGLAARVSLNKGCYVGQETLARLATYDGVKQQLRRWFRPAVAAAEAGACEPVAGQELRDAQGERAGRLTSALKLADGRWIGLALVRRAWLEAPWLEAEGCDGRLWLSTPPELVPPPQGPAGKGGARPSPQGP